MKKVMVLIICIFVLTGCFKRYNMEGIEIITTLYPIEYVTNRIYGDYSTITSMYPKGSNANTYDISEKQLKDYSKKDLFIYNDSEKEKNYAINMINQNNDLKIINATYGINQNNSKYDIWLNPSNMLMIGQNIKNELEGYITNPYLTEDIEKNYNKFKLDITSLETEYKKTAENSGDSRLITSDETLKFLEKYGFTIINLTENGEIKENNLLLAESLLKSKKLSYIFVNEFEEKSETINKLTNDYGVSKLVFKILITISEEDSNSKEGVSSDYLSIMYDNIESIKKETFE